jgi:hypothetical protein
MKYKMAFGSIIQSQNLELKTPFLNPLQILFPSIILKSVMADTYLIEAFQDLHKEDGLLAMGRGLAVRRLFVNFLQYYCQGGKFLLRAFDCKFLSNCTVRKCLDTYVPYNSIRISVMIGIKWDPL